MAAPRNDRLTQVRPRGRRRSGGRHAVAALTCALALMLSAASAATGDAQHRAPEEAPTTPTRASAQAASSAPDVTTAHVDSLVPTRVTVPAIGIDAEVIDLGLNPDGSLEVPTDFAQTGWWSGGSNPGEPGPAVIAGHVDSQTGPAVFYRLAELATGDVITVADDAGMELRFAVDRLEQHEKGRFPTEAVYTRTNVPTLRLITCGGSFDDSARSYRDNIIVFASLE